MAPAHAPLTWSDGVEDVPAGKAPGGGAAYAGVLFVRARVRVGVLYGDC